MKSKIPVVSSGVPMPVVRDYVIRLSEDLKKVLSDMKPGQSMEVDERMSKCVRDWASRRGLRFTVKRQDSGKFRIWKVGPAV